MSDPYDALNHLAEEFWRNAEEKGFHPQAPGIDDIKDPAQRFVVNNMVKLGLVVSEIGEAIEELRDPARDPQRCYDADGRPYVDAPVYETPAKPTGYGSELADIVIRALHAARDAGIDIGAEVRRKHRYNKTRPRRHGGKRA